jgi:drug/metabolite transporter (DMT)-like permease
MLQNAIYGFGDPISKAAYEHIPVYSLLSVRYAISVGFLLLLFGKRTLAGLRASSVKDWLMPSLCIAGAYLVGNLAIDLTAATSVAFLRSLSTVMTPLLAWAVYRRKFSRKHIPLQILVIVGLYLLCGLGGLSGFGWGEVFSLLSALFLAGSLIFGEKALDRVDPITLTTVQAGASAVMAVVCALVFDHGFHLSGATPKVWAIIVYMALACTVGGYLLQNRALTLAPARTVALVQCVCPVMTALFSFLLLGERLSLWGFVGAALLLVCVAGETLIGDAGEKES